MRNFQRSLDDERPREPAAANSLQNSLQQGIFANPAARGRFWPDFLSNFEKLARRIPYSAEQGILDPVTGKIPR
jgi:hypothetical protein